MNSEQVIEIYTDGACSGNPGPGGWGAVLRCGPRERDLHGGDPGPTTNNRMELMAPIQALRVLTRPATLRIYTDSTYVRDGVLSWLPRWKANGWLTRTRQPVKNIDLWQQLDTALAPHQAVWHWVKGHSGHPDNERADRLASRGVREVLGSPPTRPPRREPVAGQQCQALTRARRPCPIVPGATGLCHVHDPALQCGAVGSNGKRCGAATAGRRCKSHQGEVSVAVDLFSC
ncbi:hypothetical protein GCM10010452_72520 [Crossiella cryophila]|uniref:Ribonuclease H n=1 Tax=Crossiella cryophila TaxID=43355 RepID=A0A7W7CC62_9PSEU|nr:ribonuclease HI [Crossiella cryophila]